MTQTFDIRHTSQIKKCSRAAALEIISFCHCLYNNQRLSCIPSRRHVLLNPEESFCYLVCAAVYVSKDQMSSDGFNVS